MDQTNRSIAKRQIARLLGSSSNPIYVISENDTLVFANEAMGRLVSRTPESLLGLHCNSPLPDDGNEDADLSAFLSLPSTWSRQVLKIVPELGQVPSKGEVQTDGDVTLVTGQWIRCLIPLEESDGCTLCIFCPSPKGALSELIDIQASNTQRIMRENRTKYSHMDSLWFLQGESIGMQRALEQFQIAIANPLSLTIFGQKGSGRTWLAQAIQSKRRGLKANERKFKIGESLVRIDCSLMDLELIQSMLEVVIESKTTDITGATILLDNLECLPEECLSVLASFLKSYADIVCIATCDPIRISTFAENELRWNEVLFRTTSIRVDLPRLADRLEDIPTLISAWFDTQRKKDAALHEFSEDFVDALIAYAWPDDIEEFDQALSYAISKCTSEQLTEKDLPVNIRTCASHIEHTQVDESVDLDSILEDVEKTMILRAMERFPQNKTSAARILNISRARLLRRLQQWGLQSDFGTVDGDDDMPVFKEVT